MSSDERPNTRATQSSLLHAIPSIPRDDNEPVFHEPWQAEIFATTLALFEAGVFTWPEWAHTLSNEIKRAQQAGDADLGDTYYHHWLNALERILIDKELGSQAQLSELYQRWDHAARTTPHGQAIVLR